MTVLTMLLFFFCWMWLLVLLLEWDQAHIIIVHLPLLLPCSLHSLAANIFISLAPNEMGMNKLTCHHIYGLVSVLRQI